MRSDLPIPIQRNLEWQRRSFLRRVGAMYTELVRIGVDPTDFMGDVNRAYERYRQSNREAA